MIILIVLFMLSLSYALAFKEDFPKVILIRSVIFFLVLMALLNIRVLIQTLIFVFTTL